MPRMWKIHKISETDAVVLCISGRIGVDELLELRKLVSTEESEREPVHLDLANVRLVNHQVVEFLACHEAKGSRLRNCPPYIREWIEREKAGGTLARNHARDGANGKS
jgi:hypothetical protein